MQGFTVKNTSFHDGIGIYVLNSSPTITKNIVTGVGYVGVDIVDGSAPLVTSNTIMNSGAVGIATFILTKNGVEIANNTIQNNGTTGLSFQGNSMTGVYQNVHHNLITGNRLDGISINGSEPQILNNTITGNSRNGVWVSLWAGKHPKISNNIITSNGQYGFYMYTPTTNLNHSYNDVWNNALGNYFGGERDKIGEIHLDPLLDTSYHINAGSPAIDSGDPTKKDPDGTRSDMGAYYYQGGKKYKNIDQK